VPGVSPYHVRNTNSHESVMFAFKKTAINMSLVGDIALTPDEINVTERLKQVHCTLHAQRKCPKHEVMLLTILTMRTAVNHARCR
jgi:hypothetical protein